MTEREETASTSELAGKLDVQPRSLMRQAPDPPTGVMDACVRDLP